MEEEVQAKKARGTTRTLVNGLQGFCALNVVELINHVSAWVAQPPVNEHHARAIKLCKDQLEEGQALQRLIELNPAIYAYNTRSFILAGIATGEAVPSGTPCHVSTKTHKHSATNPRAKFGRAHIVAWAKEHHALKLVELKAQHAKAKGSTKGKLAKQIKAMELNLPTFGNVMANTALESKNAHVFNAPTGTPKYWAHINGQAQHVAPLAFTLTALLNVAWA